MTSNHKWHWVSKCNLRVCMIFAIVVNDVVYANIVVFHKIHPTLYVYKFWQHCNCQMSLWVCVERDKSDGFTVVLSSCFLCPPLPEVTSLCFMCYVVSLLSTRGIESSD